jgi:hypothetical protein
MPTRLVTQTCAEAIFQHVHREVRLMGVGVRNQQAAAQRDLDRIGPNVSLKNMSYKRDDHTGRDSDRDGFNANYSGKKAATAAFVLNGTPSP